jgi:hypothetical protein
MNNCFICGSNLDKEIKNIFNEALREKLEEMMKESEEKNESGSV